MARRAYRDGIDPRRGEVELAVPRRAGVGAYSNLSKCQDNSESALEERVSNRNPSVVGRGTTNCRSPASAGNICSFLMDWEGITGCTSMRPAGDCLCPQSPQ